MNFKNVYDGMKPFEKLVWHTGDFQSTYADRAADGYYVETGRYKPWSTGTVRAAERRGLIRVARYLSDMGIFYVVLTNEGVKAFKDLQTRF